jgi:DNA-binding response OmpR family regulator
MVDNLMKILILEDNPDIIFVLKEIFEEITPDFKIDFYEDGSYAWDKLVKYPEEYDVVVLDEMVPGKRGIELLRLIKNDELLKRIPVIMQSGKLDSNIVDESIRLGAEKYFIKPYKITDLISTIEMLS